LGSERALKRRNKIGKVFSLEFTDIAKVFFMPHHVGHCCTNVIKGQCCSTTYSNNGLGSFLLYCYNQDDGNTGTSKHGGQTPGCSWLALGVEDTTWGCHEGGLVPESGIAPSVAKSLGGRPGPPKASII
jgi:hypothetical protein